jgi:hypothetical protein
MNTVPGIGLAYRNWNSLYFLPVKKFFKTKESGCLHGCYSYPQCSGSTTFLRGSGSADPCLWLMDPDPDHGSGSCNFCHWPWQQKIFYTICFACYFLKVHLHYFSKTKSQKESQNSRIQGFSYYFCMMIEGSGSGSIPLTSGSGSGRPKNTWIPWIRIRNTASNPTYLFTDDC